MRLSNARTINFNALDGIATPKPTDTWHPMSHSQVMTTVMGHAKNRGLNIDEVQYQIVPVKGSIYPDMLSTMYMKSDNGVYQHILGIRNSHNKRFGASACSGSRVIVCSNGCFSGEHIISAKHTKNVEDTFDTRVYGMIDDVITNWGLNEARYNGYRTTELTNEEFAQLLGEAITHYAINPSKALKVYNEYTNPRHDVFTDRNAWSAFNAFTEIHKESPTSINDAAKRGIALHQVFDKFCSDAIEYETTTYSPDILEHHSDNDGDALDIGMTAEDVEAAQNQRLFNFANN